MGEDEVQQVEESQASKIEEAPLEFEESFIQSYYNTDNDNEWNYLRGFKMATRKVKDRTIDQIDLSLKHHYLTDSDSDNLEEDEFEPDCFISDVGISTYRKYIKSYTRIVHRKEDSSDDEEEIQQDDGKRSFEHRFYNHVRFFKYGSELIKYLRENAPHLMDNLKTCKSLNEIMMAMKWIITTKRMYDPTNPHIIVFDKELSKVMKMNTVHISDIIARILEETEPLKSPELNFVPDSLPSIRTDNVTTEPCWADTEARLYKVKEKWNPKFDTKGHYIPSEKMFKVLYDVDGVQWSQKVFKHDQICAIISKYITKHMREIVDNTNIRTLHIEGTTLGDCFEVNYVARNQMAMFIRHELTPATGIFHPDYANMKLGLMQAIEDDMNSDGSDWEKEYEEIKEKSRKRIREREEQEKKQLESTSKSEKENPSSNKGNNPIIRPKGPSRKICQIIQTPSSLLPNWIKTFNYKNEWSVEFNQKGTEEDAKRG